jgi:hypothetical protein
MLINKYIASKSVIKMKSNPVDVEYRVLDENVIKLLTWPSKLQGNANTKL